MTTMMMAMERRPPEHGLLCGTHREEREGELAGARGLEGAVREEPMVARRDAEHPDDIEGDREHHRGRRHPRPERGQGREVDEDEGCGVRVDDVVVELARSAAQRSVRSNG